MNSRVVVVVLLLGLGLPIAHATVVGADFVVVLNGQDVRFGDLFDNGVLDMPPWMVITGAPGPESGTLLTMQGGDMILAPFAVDPVLSVEVQADFVLTDFPSGSSATLWIYGDSPGDLLTLTVFPGGAIMTDEATVLGTTAIPPSPTALLDVMISAGVVTGSVDGVTVFSGANSFAPAVGLALSVLPEPATLCLLALGLALRRR